MIPTFVISLRGRGDRRKAFSLPWECEFILQDRIINDNIEDGFSRSNLGAACAHRSAVAKAKELGLPEVLVLEDDAVYISGSPVKSLGKITFLGGIATPYTEAVKSGESLKVKNISAAHAIIYREDSYDRVLQNIPTNEQANKLPNHVSMPYEWWLTEEFVCINNQPSFGMLPMDHPAATSESVGNDSRDLNSEQDEFYKYLKQI